MPTASLLIAVEGGSDIRRAFGQIASEHKKLNDVMITGSRKAAASIIKDYEKITKAAIASTMERIRLEQHVNETRVHLTDTAQSAVKNLISQGVTHEKSAATEKERIYKKLAQDFIKAEKEKTTGEDREIRRRNALERSSQPGQGVGSGSGATGRGGGGGWRERSGRAMGFVGAQMAAASDRTMAAQDQYAAFERSTEETLFQTTSNRAEIAHRRGQMMAYAQAHNMRFEDVAEAAAEAQGQFGTLGSRSDTVGTRNQRMDSFLTNLGEARAMGQDVTQFSRFAGALSMSGLSQGQQTSTMRAMTGMAMRGSVEMGDLSKQGLRSIMSSLGQTMSHVGPNATQAQTDSALNETLQQQVAAMQILSPRGINATMSGNALTSISQKLGGERTQTALLAHVRNQFGANSQLEGQLFQRNAQGQSALKGEYRDVYRLGEKLSDATGDPDTLRNLLATQTDRASGHVLREVFLKNERNTLAGLSQRGAGGETGFEAMRRLKEGAPLTQADVDSGREIFEKDTTSRQTHLKQEAMVNLLGGNDDRAASLQREREAKAPGFYNLISGIPAGIGTFIAQSVFRGQAGVEGATGSRQNTMGGLPGIGANGLPVSFTGGNIAELAKAIGSEIRQNPPVINVDGHTLAHLRTVEATGADTPSPADRAARR